MLGHNCVVSGEKSLPNVIICICLYTGLACNLLATSIAYLPREDPVSRHIPRQCNHAHLLCVSEILIFVWWQCHTKLLHVMYMGNNSQKQFDLDIFTWLEMCYSAVKFCAFPQYIIHWQRAMHFVMDKGKKDVANGQIHWNTLNNIWKKLLVHHTLNFGTLSIFFLFMEYALSDWQP